MLYNAAVPTRTYVKNYDNNVIAFKNMNVLQKVDGCDGKGIIEYVKEHLNTEFGDMMTILKLKADEIR